jgi:uncharacterized protein (TIGR02996 family)
LNRAGGAITILDVFNVARTPPRGETMPTNPEYDTPERRALEAALVENPDDLATHSDYADYLAEQGDPRGEFVQTQLALEDSSRPLAERGRLALAEKKLLKARAAEWLGDAGRFLVGDWSGGGLPYHVRFRRGWPDLVRTLPAPEEVVAAVARSPEFRLLRHLEVVYDMRYHPFEFDQFTRGPAAAVKKGEMKSEAYDARATLPLVAASPHLTNLRVLKYGFSDDDGENLAHSTMVSPFGDTTSEAVHALLENCPRLEELYLNTAVDSIDEVFMSHGLARVRVLQYYFGTMVYTNEGEPAGVPYPLTELAENESLANLTTLRLHPGRDAEILLDEFEALVESENLPALRHLQVHMTTFGDEGADRVVRSGILKRLKALDLGYGNMTDDGARLLAACPDVKHLDVLTLSRNALTAAGVRALRDAGVNVVADDQHDPDETDYLFEVDRE